MKIKFAYLTFTLIALAALLPGATAQAAGPVGRLGWHSPISDILGDDASCGLTSVNLELMIRDVTAGNPVVGVSSALLAVSNQVTGVMVTSVNGTGSIIGPICFDPDTQVINVQISGGSGYYDFGANSIMENPATLPRNKHMRGTGWLTPTPAGQVEYTQLSPVNIITNINPSYRLQLNAFPPTYGATGLSRSRLFVVEWDLVNNTYGATKINADFPLSGGVGVKTIPAQSIADGVYVWMFYLGLNGSHNTGGYVPTQELKSGLATRNWPFMLDTTPPSIDPTTGHAPTDPYSSEEVTVTGSASDALAGIVNVKVFVDGTLECNQDFNYKHKPSACVVVVGPYAEGTTHPYYAVATDGAGNVTTSAVQNFTISRLPVVTAIANASCGSKEINLTWSPSSGAISYEIKRDNEVPVDVGNVTAYTDTGLNDATPYSYLVRAIQTRGPSAWSVLETTAITASSCSFTITADPASTGTLTPLGVTNVMSGGSQTYSITPTGAHTIATVLVDTINNPAAVLSGTYTFTNVLAPHTISATFTQVPPPPAPTMTPNQTVSSGAVWSVSMTGTGSSVDCEFERTSAVYGYIPPAMVGLSFTANAAAGAFIGPGTATYSARCKDTYGQWSPLSTSVVTVSTSIPSRAVDQVPGNFGEIPLGGDTGVVTFRVSNPTGDAGSLLSGTVILTDSHFSCAPCSYTNIPVNGWQDIVVTYLPTVIGFTDSGFIRFTDNAPLAPYEKQVWGKGVSPIVFVPDPVNFGNVQLIRSKDLPLVVRNISTFPAGPSTITVPAPYSCVPASDCASAFIIPPLGSKTVTLHFQPIAVQSYTRIGTLLPQLYDFTITGAGVAAVFKVEEN